MVSSFFRARRHLTANRVLVLALRCAGAAPASLSGCSAEGRSAPDTPGTGGTSGESGGGGAGGSGCAPLQLRTLVSISVEPPTATLVSKNGSRPEQLFHLVGSYDDGSRQSLGGATFALDGLTSGAIGESSGVFTGNGVIGGTATLPGDGTGAPLSATATVEVKLDDERNETCSTSAYCCDGRSCFRNVRIDPLPN
jgi:hypothetical protein